MATDLVENYRPGEQGLFVRDILAGTTTLIVSGIPESRIIVNKRKLELQSNGGIQPRATEPKLRIITRSSPPRGDSWHSVATPTLCSMRPVFLLKKVT